MKNIVLFGGTFDPVHHGHLIVARSVAESLASVAVTLVPAARGPHKPDTCTPAEHRLRMLRLAIEAEAGFDICELELERRGSSYTVETLKELRRLHGPEAQLNWVIGADMLPELHTWSRIDEVMELARLVTALRPPWQDRMEDVFSSLSSHLPAEQIGRLRRSVISTPLIDISSSEIRHRVRSGRSIRFMVPQVVGAYIEAHGLYASGG